jgi:hypothetical protein
MRKRLEELSGRMQPHSLDHTGRGEALEVLDSKPCEILAFGSTSQGREFLGEADGLGLRVREREIA